MHIDNQTQKHKPAKTARKAGGFEGQCYFHIDAVNRHNGYRTRLTTYPMPQHQCETMMNKITRFPWRRLELVPDSEA